MSGDPWVEYSTRMASAVTKAKRRGNVPLPPSFVIARAKAKKHKPPLAKMIQGGHGGEVRLKVYLCITMMATSPPFDIKKPPTPAGWSRLLGFNLDKGPRRVTDALKWLEAQAFLKLSQQKGAPDSITLLNPSGNASPYKRPITDGRYVGVPAAFWSNGWILELSPVAIAVFLSILEFQGGAPAGSPGKFIPTERKVLYGLSQDSWTKARQELEGHELITVGRELLGGDHDFYRKRNTYKAHLDRLAEPPATTDRFLARFKDNQLLSALSSATNTE